MRLAANPLLLTTLLLVKRWVGQLPTKRVILYNKAIEVLLMTWNVEAHQPLDPEEIVPQLAFVAHSMMASGIQQISQRQLYRLLLLARKQMPEVLGFARLSSAEVVKSVEFRSSLLVQAGHAVEDGELVPVYEFRHLTFQEYLAARALVEGFYVDRRDADTLLGKLESHLEDETWAEVVPLAAVISGRKCEPLVKALIQLAKRDQSTPFEPSSRPAEILARCLSDEVQVSLETLDEAFGVVIRANRLRVELSELLDSRYGDRFRELVFAVHASSSDAMLAIGTAVAEVMLRDAGVFSRDDLNTTIVDQANALLRSSDSVEIARGCLAIMEVAFVIATKMRVCAEELQSRLRVAIDGIVSCVGSRDLRVRFAAAWASAWLGEAGLLDESCTLTCASELLASAIVNENEDITYVAMWAFAALPPTNPDSFRAAIPCNDALRKFVNRHAADEPDNRRKDHRVLIQTLAMLTLYYGIPWSVEEAVERIMATIEFDAARGFEWAVARLPSFGEPGRTQLARLQAMRPEASIGDAR